MPDVGQKAKGRIGLSTVYFHLIAPSFTCGVTPKKKALAVIHREGLISVEPAKRLELLTC